MTYVNMLELEFPVACCALIRGAEMHSLCPVCHDDQIQLVASRATPVARMQSGSKSSIAESIEALERVADER